MSRQGTVGRADIARALGAGDLGHARAVADLLGFEWAEPAKGTDAEPDETAGGTAAGEGVDVRSRPNAVVKRMPAALPWLWLARPDRYLACTADRADHATQESWPGRQLRSIASGDPDIAASRSSMPALPQL